MPSLRYHEAGVDAGSPKAYLATVTTRRAIDHLRSVRVRRELYPGEWLPEPIVDDEAVRHAETADALSLAFHHLLEKLSPVERAVFLLREVFVLRAGRARSLGGVARVAGGMVVAVSSILSPDKLTHVPAR